MTTSRRRHPKLVYVLLAVVVIGATVFLVMRMPGRRAPRFPNRTGKNLSPSLARPAQADSFGDVPPADAADAGIAANRVATIADLHAALLEALKKKSPRQRMDAVFVLGQKLGAEDFDHALVLAKRVPVEWMKGVMISGIFLSRGRSNGADLVRQLEAVKKGTIQDPYELHGVDDAFALGGAIVGWASVDPAAAIVHLKESQDSMAELAYAAWGFNDLDAVLANANTLPPGVQAAEGQEAFLNWAKSEPERAVDYALTLDENLRNMVLDRIAQGWASNWSEKYRPDLTSYLMIAMGRGDGEGAFSESLYRWWAQYEPEQAVHHAAESDTTEHLRDSLVFWIQSDPAQALDWLSRYSAQQDDKNKFPLEVIGHISEVDAATAARVFDSMPALTGETSLLKPLFDKWSEIDPSAAYDWITGKHVDPDVLVDAARSTAVNWSQWNITEALDWAQHLTDSAQKATALGAVAFVAGYADPPESTDWIRELPPGHLRDRSVTGYITGVLEHVNGSSTPDEYALKNATTSLVDLPPLIQKSTLDDRQKQQLLALVYGWSSNP